MERGTLKTLAKDGRTSITLIFETTLPFHDVHLSRAEELLIELADELENLTTDRLTTYGRFTAHPRLLWENDYPARPIDLKYLTELLAMIERRREEPEDVGKEAGEITDRLVTSTLRIASPANQAGNYQLPLVLAAVQNYYPVTRPESIQAMLGNYIRQNIADVVLAAAPEATEAERNALTLSMLFEADKMDSEAYDES